MSYLKVVNLQHPTSANVNITLDANSNMYVNNTAINYYQGMKNRIINGAMNIDQHDSGASATPASNSLGYRSCDRWQSILSIGSKYSVQQTPSTTETGYATRLAAGFTNYFAITSLSAFTSPASTDYLSVRQFIEGYNMIDFAWGTTSAKPIAVSFWAYSSLTGTFSGAIVNGQAGVGSGETRSYVFNYSIPTAYTWTYISIIIPGDTGGATGAWPTSNGGGLQLRFNLGSGSNYLSTAGSWQSGNYIGSTGSVGICATNGAVLYLTGVQLEVGSVSSAFERRHISAELSLCQRYYWQLVANNTASQGILAQGYMYGLAQWESIIKFPVPMRVIPTVTFTANTTFTLRPSGTSITSLNYYNIGNPMDTQQILIYTANPTNASYGAGTSQSLATPATPGANPTGIYFNSEIF